MYPKYIWKLILFITSTIYYTLPIECIVFIVSEIILRNILLESTSTPCARDVGLR